jgi:hypothetical protein
MGINDNAVPRTGRRKTPEKVADLEYEVWRRDMVYRIYGPQETVRTRRGRVEQ